MFETLLKYFIRFGLFTATLSALFILGAVVNSIVPWIWLTNFFVIMRRLLSVFNWILAIDQLIIILGLSLTLKVSISLYDLSRKVFGYFNPHA